MATTKTTAKKIPMRKRIQYLERDIKTLNRNIKNAKDALEFSETTIEGLRQAWERETQRSAFLVKELNESQLQVAKLQTVVDTSDIFRALERATQTLTKRTKPTTKKKRG